MVRHVDRQMNALPTRPTYRLTDRLTQPVIDVRGAFSHLEKV